MGTEKNIYYHGNLRLFYAVVKPGDILEFPRGNYSHYGVYIGQYKGIRHCVVHLTVSYEPMQGNFLLGLSASLQAHPSQNNSNFVSNKIAGANAGNTNIDSVEEIMKEGGCVIINNSNDKKWKAFKPKQIVDRAIDYYEYADEKPNYSLVKNNCEHVVNEIRYDRHESDQVKNAFDKLGLAILGAILFGYLIKRVISQDK